MTAIKDELVVKATFDAREFQQGVKHASDSLDKLKSSLEIYKDAGSFKAFKQIAKQTNSISFKGLKSDLGVLADFGKEVDKLTNKTSLLHKAFENVGFWLKKNVVEDAYKKLKGIVTAIPNQIISGGKARAQNIEQAQFQLKGLLKDKYDWKVISEDIDHAVAGTRYGLDAAAKVAAQLSASNINFGDDMKKALRGISGVAAMTNSEYEEIGHIFTTIAGQGKVMTQQLNQFAGRGLNVAAELAKYYKVSEAELREMVTKGKVHFKEFAEAMDSAFGEQATHANDTFTGALSNVKASLSRMGAQFMTPGFEALRKVLVMLIPVLKDVEKFLKPVSARFEELAEAVAKIAGDTLRDIHFDFLETLGFKGTSFASQVSKVQEIYDGLHKNVEKSLTVEAKDAGDAAKEAVKTEEKSLDVYEAIIEAYDKIQKSKEQQLKAGADEATVLHEEEVAIDGLLGYLIAYDKEVHGASAWKKELREQTKRSTDAISKEASVSLTARDRAFALFAARKSDTEAVKENTAARKDATQAVVESTMAMADAGKTAASNLFGVESGEFDTSVKKVTDLIAEVKRESDNTFQYGTLGQLIDPAKKLSKETEAQKRLYTELEKAVDEINKTAEKQIKLGKDETVVNAEKEAALKRLRNELEAYDKQSIFSLDTLIKDSNARQTTTKLYDNAKKTVSGLKDGFLKLLGVEKEEGDQISKNAGEYQGLEDLAWEVISGKYDNGEERKQKLEELGYAYSIVQNKVNELLGCEKRHEVTAEDEAKMAEKLGGSLGETGKAAEKQKTTYEKLLDVLAGIGAAITIIRNAASAVLDNIIRPFVGWALPKIFDAILSCLSPIGEGLVNLNEIWTKDFFDTKTKDIANWFINAKDSVVEFWGKAKELTGVKKLQEAFEKFKTTLSEIGGKIFGKITEGFGNLGKQGQSIFTMENMLKVLNSLADSAANFLNFISEHKDDIINVLKNVYNFLIMFKNGIIAFFKDPIGSIKLFSQFLQNNLDKVRDRIRAFCDNLAKDPKATLTEFFSKLYTTFKVVKDNIVNFFSNLFTGKSINVADAVSKSMDFKAGAASLFGKFKAFFNDFADGIKAFFDESGIGGKVILMAKEFIGKIFANFDPKKAGIVAGVGGVGLIAAKIAKFILSLKNTFSLAKELPKKATELLSGLKGVLDGYAMNLKTDALLKVAGAIGIFALAITALSFLDEGKLLAVGGSLGAITVGMAALIAAIAMYNKAKAMAKAAGIAETMKGAATAAGDAVKSSGEAAKTAMSSPFAPIYQSVSDFMTGMKDALSKAMKTASMGVFLVMLAASIAILVHCVKSLLEVDWEKEGIPAAKAVGAMLLALVASVAFLNKLGGNGLSSGTGIAILGLVASLHVLIGVIKTFSKLATDDPDSLNTGITYVAMMLAGFALFSRALQPEGLLKAAASLIVFTIGLRMLIVPLLILAAIPTDLIVTGILRMVEVLGVMVMASWAAAEIDENGGGVTALLKLAGVLVLLVPAMILLGATGAIAGKGIISLGFALGVLVAAAIVLNKFGGDGLEKIATSFYNIAKGALILGPAIVLLGVCLAGFGALLQKFAPQILIGFAAFAAGLTVIGFIASKFAVGFAAISLPLVALVGVILAFVLAAALLPGAAENIKNFFSGVTSIVGGIASGIGKLFGLFEEQEEKYETALDKYDKSLNKLSYLSDEVKTELHNRFAELEHLDGSQYSIGIDNLVGYIYGLDLTPQQIQKLLTETMTELQESAREQFTIAFMKVEADIKKLDLSEDEQTDLLEKVKALASTVSGEFQTEIKTLKTKIDDIIDDPTAAARIYNLAVNAAKAEAVYKTVMDELEIYLNKCSLSDQAKETIKTSIANITASDLNTDYYVTLGELKAQIEDNALELDEFQQKKLSSMVDAAIKAGTTANLLVNSVLVAIENESGIELSSEAKESIKNTIQDAAQLSLTNPEEAKTKVDNLVVELGNKYGWSPTAQKLLGGLIQNAFKAKSVLTTKLGALGVYTNKLGLTEKNDDGLTFAEQVTAAINEQQFPPIELKNIWFEIKNANMTPEEVEDLYTQVGNTINAAVNKEIALSNLSLALDEVPGLEEEDKKKILEEIENLGSLEGGAKQAKIEEIIELTYALADDTEEGRAGVQAFLDDLGIYTLQAEDFRTVTIKSMKVAIEGVAWGEGDGETKQDFIDKIEELAHLSGEPLKAAVDDFIIALNNNPTIPGSVKTALEEQARGLVSTYTTAYEDELAAFFERQAAARKKKYLGSFITDEGTGYMVKNGSAAAKGIKAFFEGETKVTEEAYNGFMDYIEEQINSGALSPEDLMAGLDGLDMSDEEFINHLFPNGTFDVIDPEFFRKYFEPIIEAYVTGASEEYKYRLSRDEPGKYDFTEWLINQVTSTNENGEQVVDYLAMHQMSDSIDEFLDGEEEAIRDVIGKYDGELTIGDALTALYGSGEEITDTGLQSALVESFERITHDTELLEALWKHLQELRKDNEFNEDEYFSQYEGTGEELAKLTAQDTNEGFATYYNLDPAKKTLVDKLQDLMHPGEEINPEELYKELDDAFEKLGIHLRELGEDGEWVQTDELLTMEKVLGSDDPLHFLTEYVSLDAQKKINELIPGFSQLIANLASTLVGKAGETREQVAEKTKEEISEGVSEGAEAGMEEAAAKAKNSSGIADLVTDLLSGDKSVGDAALAAIQEGLSSGGDGYKSQLMEALGSALGLSDGFSLTSLLGEGVDLSTLPESITSLIGSDALNSAGSGVLEKIVEGIQNGTIDSGKMTSIAGNITGGLKDGLLDPTNLLSITQGGDGVAGELIKTICDVLGIKSPSTVMKALGEYADAGFALGLVTGKSKVIRQAMSVVKAAIDTIKDRIAKFTSAGTETGAAYATGISGTSTLARIAGEMISWAAEWAIRQNIDAARRIGEDWGQGFVEGLESKVDDAKRVGEQLEEVVEKAVELKGKIHSPSRVAMRLGNYWGMGYVNGLNEYVEKAGKAGRELGDATIHALETPMRLIQNILDSGVDTSPVITPVLDLSDIQNGARQINGLLPAGAMDLGTISYAMSNRRETTNADVVSAILGLGGTMETSRGDTYNINGITYDDGSNIVDAVQALVRAARVERRR